MDSQRDLLEKAMEVGEACGRLEIGVELLKINSTEMYFELSTEWSVSEEQLIVVIGLPAASLQVKVKEEWLVLSHFWSSKGQWRSQLYDMLDNYQTSVRTAVALSEPLRRDMLPGESAMGVEEDEWESNDIDDYPPGVDKATAEELAFIQLNSDLENIVVCPVCGEETEGEEGDFCEACAFDDAERNMNYAETEDEARNHLARYYS